MEVRSSSGKEPRVVRLPGDLVAEILARVTYRSLCRFKLVSRSWRALCSDPAVRRRCPQTLAGLFFRTMPLGAPSRYFRHFVNASGRGAPMVDPSFSFLPAKSFRDVQKVFGIPCHGRSIFARGSPSKETISRVMRMFLGSDCKENRSIKSAQEIVERKVDYCHSATIDALQAEVSNLRQLRSEDCQLHDLETELLKFSDPFAEADQAVAVRPRSKCRL